ncbi:hypothetical protein [Lysinibacillus sp. Ag94]|uniref:hypothetical protein n=1 Tax=Lysinibacillus sp. Ag94 TaxID=2936682 RepID=UPI00200FC8F9|nr:hypothetical protein [Lysinibacillus sp. Ag94]UPW84416.1 hypothetical protein MY533_05980 [Lysinibacillus sp. Ag94]
MIDYMTFDVMWMDDIIAHVELIPANGGTPYVINYIEDFNKQFSPTMKGHRTENTGVMADDEIWI